MVATDWKKLDASAPADLVPAGYAISGLFDLAPLLHLATNADFKLDDAEARAHLAAVLAGRRRAACSTPWSAATNRRSSCGRAKIIADAWRERGVETRYEAVPGMNHFTVFDPMTDPNSAMTKRLVELAKRKPRTNSARRTPRSAPRRPRRSPHAHDLVRNAARQVRAAEAADQAAGHHRPASAASSPRRWR